MNKRTLSVSVFLILLSSLIIFSSVLAQTQSKVNAPGVNIEISPLPIELSAKPGTATSTDLRVRNSGANPEKLKAILKTFSAEGPQGNIVLHDPSPDDDFTRWVSFDKPVFDAPPGQWQTVKMTINVPKSAAFGYYYAVQFELANPPKPQPGATSLQGAVVIFVLLNAEAPGAVKKVEVKSFTADHQSYEFLPVSFKVAVHNSGNLHVAPHGNIFISRGSHQIASLSVNATRGIVLPGSNRNFSASWNDGFPAYNFLTDTSGQSIKDSNGNPQKNLKWSFSQVSHLRFGHYTANLLLIYNDGQRDIPVNGTLSFWVIPWRLLGVLLVVGIFMTIGFWSTFKKLARFLPKKNKKAVKEGKND
jgi:hypothetical protein